MIIHCKYDDLLSRNLLKPHPQNRNKHPVEQIERLARILKYQGWRYPIKISKRSGYVTSGHGRIEAAWLNGWTEVPVNYQDYESEEQEYADVVADNAIASWSELDLSAINTDLADLGPDFDIDLLGIRDFVLEPADKEGPLNEEKTTLADRFLIPPFSTFNAREGWWQERKRQWIALGIQSELGRGDATPPGGSAEPLARFASGQKSTWSPDKKLREREREDKRVQKPRQAKPNTLGAIAPNQKDILKRTGKYG